MAYIVTAYEDVAYIAMTCIDPDGRAYRHVLRHVYRHVCRHAHRREGRHMHGHLC